MEASGSSLVGWHEEASRVLKKLGVAMARATGGMRVRLSDTYLTDYLYCFRNIFPPELSIAFQHL